MKVLWRRGANLRRGWLPWLPQLIHCHGGPGSTPNYALSHYLPFWISTIEAARQGGSRVLIRALAPGWPSLVLGSSKWSFWDARTSAEKEAQARSRRVSSLKTQRSPGSVSMTGIEEESMALHLQSGHAAHRSSGRGQGVTLPTRR